MQPETLKLGFIGAGKMGEAIIAALLRSGFSKPAELLVCEALAERRTILKRRYRMAVTAEPLELPPLCHTIVLALKPQDLDTLLQQLAPQLTRKHLLISIAAGKQVARLEELSGDKCRVVRVMPNLNVAVGEGMSVFTAGARARAADRRYVARLLQSCGAALELEEAHFDAVTALSGSGPAFFAYFMESLSRAGVELGLPPEAAGQLANQTMLGTARYLRESGVAPADFIAAVASPKGTTAAGLAVLERSTLHGTVERTLKAAARRSRELNSK